MSPIGIHMCITCHKSHVTKRTPADHQSGQHVTSLTKLSSVAQENFILQEMFRNWFHSLVFQGKLSMNNILIQKNCGLTLKHSPISLHIPFSFDFFYNFYLFAVPPFPLPLMALVASLSPAPLMGVLSASPSLQWYRHQWGGVFLMQSCIEILKVKSLEHKITLVFQKQMFSSGYLFVFFVITSGKIFSVGNYSRVMFSSGQLFVVDVFLWVIINAECFYLTIIKGKCFPLCNYQRRMLQQQQPSRGLPPAP